MAANRNLIIYMAFLSRAAFGKLFQGLSNDWHVFLLLLFVCVVYFFGGLLGVGFLLCVYHIHLPPPKKKQQQQQQKNKNKTHKKNKKKQQQQTNKKHSKQTKTTNKIKTNTRNNPVFGFKWLRGTEFSHRHRPNASFK